MGDYAMRSEHKITLEAAGLHIRALALHIRAAGSTFTQHPLRNPKPLSKKQLNLKTQK